MQLSSQLLALVGLLASQTAAHGLVTKPATRQPGAATQSVCGKAMADFYKADGTSYPEALKRNKGWDGPGYDAAKCNLFLCKGYQFDDNKAQVASYPAGTVVPMEVNVRIAHRGYANVSVVDTKTNSVVGEQLYKWGDGYAASLPMPGDQTKFSVKVPDLGSKCTVAGACVIQWYWFGQGQTYQSCIDFTQTPVATPYIRGRRYDAVRNEE